jgi:tetratricopeptide (TPR) repeat protein
MVIVLSLGVMSCRKPPEVVYKATVAEAETLMRQGQAEAAVAALKTLFDDKKFEGYRPALLGMMIQYNLAGGEAEAAQALFRDVAGRDINMAVTAVGPIENHLWGAGKFDQLAAWCESLQGYALPGPVLIGVADQHLRALDAAGKSAAMPGVLAVYLGKLDEASALALAQRQFGGLLGAGRRDEAVTVRGLVEKAIKAGPVREGALANMDIDLLLSGKGWQAADDHFRKVLALIPDDSAVRNLNLVAAAMVKAQNLDAVDAMALFVLDGVKGRDPVRGAAATMWVNAAERRADTAQISKRLLGLKDMGFGPAFIMDQCDAAYSTLLDKGKKQDFAPLYDLFESYRTTSLDDNIKRRCTWVLLDLGFYLEKYEESLKLIEAGKDGDPERKALLVSKIKGHLALQKGQTQEAVEHFRTFMGYIAKGSDYEFDPVDNTRVSKEMILGLNAKRIGDILAKADKAEEAAKTYKEARDYYRKALEQFPDEKSRENAKVKKQMSEIPEG